MLFTVHTLSERKLSWAHPKGGPGLAPSLWDLSIALDVEGFFSLNASFAFLQQVGVRSISARWEDRASLQHGSGLTLAGYITPYWPLQKKKLCASSPLEKIPGMHSFVTYQKKTTVLTYLDRNETKLPSLLEQLTFWWLTDERFNGPSRA